MDADVLEALGLGRPPGDVAAAAEVERAAKTKRNRQGAAEAARTARCEKRQRSTAEAQKTSLEAVAAVAMALPVGEGLLQLPRGAKRSQDMVSVQKLAFSTRVRGADAGVKRVRRLQNKCCALVGALCLEAQHKGFVQWLETAKAEREQHCEAPFRVHALSAMWDEASQRGRALLKRTMQAESITHAQKNIEIMNVLAAVCRCRVQPQDAPAATRGEATGVFDWEPWIAAPAVLESTAQPYVLEALARALPVDMLSRASVETFADSADVSVVCLSFDSAASNVAAYSCMAAHLERGPCTSLLLHGERCMTHQLHILRSGSTTLSGFAGALYSLSRILGNSQAISGLHAAFRTHIRAKLRLLPGRAPPYEEQLQLARSIFGMDGDEAMLARGTGPSCRAGQTLFSRDIEEVCRHCRYDAESGAWLYYTGRDGPFFDRDIDMEAAADSIAKPLDKLFLGRRWEVATLSRWHGVMHCMKRLAMGTMFNKVLPQSLAAMSRQLALSEAKLEKARLDLASAILRGEDAENHWLQNASRVMKLSRFFQDEARAWQIGVVLIVNSEIERLHWLLLGRGGETRKANLGDLVDPRRSCVGQTMHQFCRLMQHWDTRGDWKVLAHLGAPAATRSEPVMKYARTLLLRIAAGLFMRVEVKHSRWPYALQILLSPGASAQERYAVVADFLAARECCLGVFGRRFRKQFPTAADILGPKARATLETWSRALKFTTAPAECEHKALREDMKSEGPAAANAGACWRAVCRRLHAAHVQRGGENMTFGSGRARKSAHPVVGDDSEQGLPFPPQRAIQDAGGGVGEPAEQAALQDAAPPAPAASRGDPSSPSCLAGQVDMGSLDAVGGGNPKIMYANYQVRTLKMLKGKLTKDEVKRARSAAVAKFDESPEVQLRWRTLFKMKLRQRRALQNQQQHEAGDGAPAASRGDAVWASTLQVAEAAPSTAPIASAILQDRREQLGNEGLELLASCPRRFIVESSDVCDHRARSAHLWGCCNEWHNVCTAGLFHDSHDGGEKLRLFRSLQSHLNAWVQERRGAVKDGEILMHFHSTPSCRAGEAVLHTWALLSFAMFSPKVQCFAQCACVGPGLGVDDEGFATLEPAAFPAVLEMEVGPSRICSSLGEAAPFWSILFETSDELLQRLLCRSSWAVSAVESHIDTTWPSLMRMVATSEGEAVEWRALAATQGEAACLAFLALPGSGRDAIELGRARAAEAAAASQA